MNSAVNVEAETLANESIWLDLRLDGVSHEFEFKADELRAVAVGSLLSADLRIDRPGVAPVQFHIEREGKALWIVPAYDGHVLRLDTARVTGPQRLDSHAVIEFAGVRLHANLLDVDLAQTSGRGELATVSFNKFVTPRIAKPEPLTQRFSLVDSAVVIPVQRTVVIEPIQVAPPKHLNQGEKIPPALSIVEHPAHDALTTGCIGGSSSFPAQDSSSFAPDPAEAGASCQSTTLFDIPFVRPPGPGARGWLVWLGLLSRRRPLSVWLGGTVSAFVLSAALVSSTKGLHVAVPQVAHSRRTTMTAPPLSSISGALKVSAPVGLIAEPVVVVRAVPSSTTKTSKKKGQPNDPELVAAVGHLIAGRYKDAQAAYTLLATQARNDPSLGAVAQLLAKKLDPNCATTAPVTGISCPEVKP
jgi:hypothetical protein